MTLGVFRTYKGQDIEKRVTAGIQFESVPANEAENRLVSEMIDFETNEYAIQTMPVSRKLVGKMYSPDGNLFPMTNMAMISPGTSRCHANS